MERERAGGATRRCGGDEACSRCGRGADDPNMMRGPKRPIRVHGSAAGNRRGGLVVTVGGHALVRGRHRRREGFAVEPFTNVRHAGALHHLVYALPALVAERFAQTAPLRFAGRDELFSRTPPTDARWLVRGAFAAQPSGKVAITVEVVRAASPDEVVGQRDAAGPRDVLAAIALDAAAAAFATLPGAPPTTEALAAARAPFNRDPTRSPSTGARWPRFTAAVA